MMGDGMMGLDGSLILLYASLRYAEWELSLCDSIVITHDSILKPCFLQLSVLPLLFGSLCVNLHRNKT